MSFGPFQQWPELVSSCLHADTLLQTNTPALCAAQHHFFPPPPQCLAKECPRGHIRGRREDWNQMNGARVQPVRQAHISLPKAWLKRGAALAGPRQLILASEKDICLQWHCGQGGNGAKVTTKVSAIGSHCPSRGFLNKPKPNAKFPQIR